MNCAELQEYLPDILESACTVEQQEHLKRCPDCAKLLADLDTIIQESAFLQGDEDPSPRVWNSIEIALRQEGLIRDRKPELAIVHRGERAQRRWNPAWLAPALAMVMVGVFGVVRYERASAPQQMAQNTSVASPSLPATSGAPAAQSSNPTDDAQLLEVVSSRVPAMRASYAADLQNVDAYIRDAEQSAKSHPNDEEAQQFLMDAYEQKAMVYDLALNRSLP